jgi:hypothetical protein
LTGVDLDDRLTGGQQSDQRIELLVEPGGYAVGEGVREQSPDRQQAEQRQDTKDGGALRKVCSRVRALERVALLRASRRGRYATPRCPAPE